jgi:predicted RecA/RadA family phage recombinase
MDAIKVREGAVIDYTASGADVDAGDVVVVGDTVAVATTKIPQNETGSLDIVGVFSFPKATGSASAIAAGKKVYWNAGSEIMTETSGGNKAAGHTVAAAADADETVLVKLAQF